MEIKEQNAPKEVKQELKKEKPQALGADTGGRSQIDPGRSDSHQRKKDSPQDGKYKAGGETIAAL